MWPKSLAITILALTFLFVQADHSDKPCVVTKVVTEGVYSDCGGWQPAKGEKMFMPGEVSKRLRVGDTFYFVWKDSRWVAEIRDADSVPVKCALVNIAPLRLACDDKDKTEIVIPIAEWPKSWHGPFLTGIYNAELRDGKLFALETLAVKGLDEGIRAKSINEQRRWRKHPTQRQ